MPPTQHRDMPSQRVLGLCWIMDSSFLSVSVKYASCILVGFMTVARPAEPARTAPDRSRWLASGRGTSSRRSFMVQSRERGRGVSKGASERSRVCRCVVPRGLRASVSDLSKRRGFLSSHEPVIEWLNRFRQANVVENGPLHEGETFAPHLAASAGPRRAGQLAAAPRRAAREPVARALRSLVRSFGNTGSDHRDGRGRDRERASSACSANSTIRGDSRGQMWTERYPISETRA